MPAQEPIQPSHRLGNFLSTGSSANAQEMERLDFVEDCLLDSIANEEIIQRIRKEWGITRRSARQYLRRVRDHWARSARESDLVARVWELKVQNEEFYQLALRHLERTTDPKVADQLLRVCKDIIKRRAKLQKQIDELKAEDPIRNPELAKRVEEELRDSHQPELQKYAEMLRSLHKWREN